MSIVDRVKNILMSPVTEWEVIAKEPATPSALLTSYAAPLATIAAVSGMISAVIFGALIANMFGGVAGGAAAAVSTVSTIVSGIIGLALSLLLVFAMGHIVSALASSFGGKADAAQGAKLIVYSGTPVWVAGFLGIIPVIGGLAVFAGLGYACYLIAIGVRPVLGIPQDKTAGMTIVTLLIYVVGAIVIAGINFAISAFGMIASSAATGI